VTVRRRTESSLVLRLATAAAAAATGLTGAAGAAEPPTVDPGSLVRWVGERTVLCTADARVWAPIDGTCWYPVDLLQPAGPLIIGRTRAGIEEESTITVAPYPYRVQRLQVADDMVHPPTESEERIEREQEKVAALWSLDGPREFNLPLLSPLQKLPAGGRFGARRIINDEPRSPHTGRDYAAPSGTPVFAAGGGRVVLAENHYFAGNSVFIHHGDGLITMYFHLRRLEVKTGQEIDRGQRIGTVGATGRATGPHLHFGIRWRGARIDPQLLLGPTTKVPAIKHQG